MTAARDDDFMALPGMEADSTDTHHARERLSDDATPGSANTSPNASSKSALDALLDEYRARAKSECLGIVFTPVEVVDFIIHSADDAMRTAFGQSLGDPGVAIIETFRADWIHFSGEYRLAA